MQLKQVDKSAQLMQSLKRSEIRQDDYKFVYTVPQMVDPDAITCIIEPTPEEGGIYLGSLVGAKDADALKKLKIRAVLSATAETAVQYSETLVQFHLVIQAHDKDNYDITQHADVAFEFIDKHRKHTNVFIHCFIGISRSVSLLVMYLMRKYNLNLEKALWRVKQKRRQVNPNAGFIKQLALYEKSLQKPKPPQNGTNFFKMIRQQAVPMQPVSRIQQLGSPIINPDVQLSRINYQKPQHIQSFLQYEHKR